MKPRLTSSPPSAMHCIKLLKGFWPFLNDFPSLYNVIRFICCLAPECSHLLRDHLDYTYYHSCWMLMVSFAISDSVCVHPLLPRPQILTHFFRAAPLFLPWYCLRGCVHHIQPRLYDTASNIRGFVSAGQMQERDVPAKWTSATIKQSSAGWSTGAQGMWREPPGLLSAQNRVSCERFTHGMSLLNPSIVMYRYDLPQLSNVTSNREL